MTIRAVEIAEALSLALHTKAAFKEYYVTGRLDKDRALSLMSDAASVAWKLEMSLMSLALPTAHDTSAEEMQRVLQTLREAKAGGKEPAHK